MAAKASGPLESFEYPCAKKPNPTMRRRGRGDHRAIASWRHGFSESQPIASPDGQSLVFIHGMIRSSSNNTSWYRLYEVTNQRRRRDSVVAAHEHVAVGGLVEWLGFVADRPPNQPALEL